jgi:hypothetical protein
MEKLAHRLCYACILHHIYSPAGGGLIWSIAFSLDFLSFTPVNAVATPLRVDGPEFFVLPLSALRPVSAVGGWANGRDGNGGGGLRCRWGSFGCCSGGRIEGAAEGRGFAGNEAWYGREEEEGASG